MASIAFNRCSVFVPKVKVNNAGCRVLPGHDSPQASGLSGLSAAENFRSAIMSIACLLMDFDRHRTSR